MSQFDWGVMDPNAKSGPQLALDLNNFRDALNSLHRGVSRPAYVRAGMLWIREVTTERWDVVLHDGQNDLVLRSLDPTASKLFKIPSSEIEGLDNALGATVQKDAPTATGAAILPAGTTAQRPAAPMGGMLRFNNSILEYERYQNGKWLALNTLDKALNEAPLVTLASSSTVDIGAAGANTINISGGATINSLGSATEGVVRRLIFQGSPVISHNSASLILPGGANITASPGDTAQFVSLGSGNWKCVGYARGNGNAVVEGGIGAGQDWVNLTASRLVGTTYTNTTGRTIYVVIAMSLTTGMTSTLTVQGEQRSWVANNGSGGGVGTHSAPVLPGNTYSVQSGSLIRWSEVRA
ncbi:hypothetical protein [Pseudomonas sp. NY15354]|uniref:hypothetical protein n=1 Tax=Pseudomonas sp. NY15354 TaxID=3400351 RepID=UPI003A88E8E9